MDREPAAAVVLAGLVADDVTEAYDAVDILVNRISVQQHRALHAKLQDAKNILFEARVIADRAAGK